MVNDALVSLFEFIFGVLGEACTPNPDWFKLTSSWSTLTSGVVSTIYDYLRFLGVGLTIAYFLMEMNQKLALEGRDLTLKSFFAPFLKFFIAVVAICYSGKIVGWIVSFGDGFIDKMDSTVVPDFGDLEAELISAIGGFGFFMAVFFFIVGIIAALIGTVLKLVWGYKAIMYKMEFLFRISLLPVAVADVYNGSHSNAIRYLKGFIAMAIWGASMIGLPKLAVEIAKGQLVTNFDPANPWNAIASLGAILVAPFAAIAATSMAKQIAKEALGS